MQGGLEAGDTFQGLAARCGQFLLPAQRLIGEVFLFSDSFIGALFKKMVGEDFEVNIVSTFFPLYHSSNSFTISFFCFFFLFPSCCHLSLFLFCQTLPPYSFSFSKQTYRAQEQMNMNTPLFTR